MNLAIIGTRGISVIYSGFETFAEALGERLVKDGYGVSVYCRSKYLNTKKKTYKGIRLVPIPSIYTKNWETFVHSMLSTLHAIIFGKYEIIYYLGVGSAVFSIIPRMFGIKTVVNVDGLDWRREKWGFVGRIYLAVSEYLAIIFSNEIVTDSRYIQKYYKDKFTKKAPYIPYGYQEKFVYKHSFLNKFKLEKYKYFVWVGRLVPDNYTKQAIKAFKSASVKTGYKLVIIGDGLNDTSYKESLLRMSEGDKNIVFTGFLERDGYATIVKSSYCYIETKRSGGTHPSLVEAMGAGCLIISNNHKANKEVLGDTAYYYKRNSSMSLQNKIDKLYKSEKLNEQKKELAKKRALKKYGWGKITKSYEKLFISLVG